MTAEETIQALHKHIHETLAPYIQSDYWLLETPFYENVGDTLIWQGEIDFLNSLPYRCKGMQSLKTFRFPRISTKDTILFQGGGNFGDLWRKHQDFRLKVIQHYPKNKFLIFPQTVHYQDEKNVKADAEFLARYDVTICARDAVSYEFLKKHFSNKILLAPDMAFCMEMTPWDVETPSHNTPLILKRADSEFKASEELDAVLKRETNALVTDWPTMMTRTPTEKWNRFIRKLHIPCLYDLYHNKIYRPYLIRAGVQVVKEHTDIYTTRLHTLILAILLKKDRIIVFDNSYGKTASFYDTWLTTCDNVTMIR